MMFGVGKYFPNPDRVYLQLIGFAHTNRYKAKNLLPFIKQEINQRISLIALVSLYCNNRFN